MEWKCLDKHTGIKSSQWERESVYLVMFHVDGICYYQPLWLGHCSFGWWKSTTLECVPAEAGVGEKGDLHGLE